MNKIIGLLTIKEVYKDDTSINYTDIDIFIKDIIDMVIKDVPFEITVFKNNIDFNIFVDFVTDIDLPTKYIVNVL